MTLETRQQAILKKLNERGFISTEELAKQYLLTPQTIRRDINALCELGLARKQHGGITLPPAMNNQNIATRLGTNTAIKQQIGQFAVRVIEPESTLFLGYGSTVVQLIESLPKEISLTVVTNNLNAALSLTQFPNIDTWVSGGRLRQQHHDLSGLPAQNFLQSFRADLAICGIAGISAEGELLEFQHDEAELTRTMLRNSKRNLLLADASKFMRSASVCVATLDQIDALYTDCNSPELAKLCQQHNVELQLIGDGL
ncbi:DeoR/GlpR transcriptional regulator [Photobacterium sp. BZF1]|uniref:DeoR/GlpR family DNA-binding transcription regulator n=1 Tax=Photobacterium sp. BZF1 TaxID=1904457 RepID=UPI001653CDB7|nr:DeoR/GlpR family DNA-binding transcription regulator [Photobacterium sp. BZF1]MBC7002748.1 DeoR/GlpR transcriptional regulator [Photobacterium sp. BZF1]